MMQRKLRVLIAFVIGAVLVLLILGYAVMNARSFQFFGKLVTHIETDQKIVYLTFDDGPTEKTPQILETLDELDIKATFFLVGKEMEEYPEHTKAILDAGHDIGNHSYTHARLVLKPYSKIKEEVDKTNALIRGFGYKRDIYFRAPGCKKLFFLPWHLESIGQTSVIWTLEPETDKSISKDAQSIADHVVANISEGGIILLHPMYGGTDKTLEAVTLIAEALKDKGYTFETLSEGFARMQKSAA